jgi:hypothetical protein
MSRDVRTFDYVNHPYPAVRDALTARASTVFAGATSAAASRAEAVAAQLRVTLGALEVSAPIEIAVGQLRESADGPGGTSRLVIPISWKARERSGLFPVMNAQLSVYPLTSTETQLDFDGHYDPPLGVLGSAIDAAVGYRVAEASVHRFVSDVAQYLRKTLG